MNTLHKNEAYFSTAQAAHMLGVTRVTIFRWIKDGTLQAKKIGRNYVIAHNDLLKLTENRPLTEEEKYKIRVMVDKAVADYGETIRMLGRE